MPYLNGHEVRRRAAEFASSATETSAEPAGTRYADHHFRWLSQQTGIPVGTLHNATREHPQVISLSRVFRLASLLRRKDEKISETVAAIVAEEEQPPAKEPESAPGRPRDPHSPPPRRGKDDNKGPRRADLKAAS